MSYDEDIDDDSPSTRKRGKRRQPGLARGRERSPAEKQEVIQSIIQLRLAEAAVEKPGQIFPVLPGNHGAHIDESIETALWAAAGKRSIAASFLGMTRKQLDDRIHNSERLQEVAFEIKELDLDATELQLDALVNAGCDKAVIFKLKTQGKHRGWAETKSVADPSRLTLDAARELDGKLMSAFAQIRQDAVEAVLSVQPPQPPAPVPLTIDVKAEQPAEDEIENADF